ncbi:MAG: DUF962 domain-containing protein [Gammaproteobacteria bacterium]|nr:DUF962 domain-containing protein [Gammaproteobacteria bacterium]
MNTLSQQLETYRHYHQNATNKLAHYVGVPALVVAVLMLLNWVSIDIAAHIKISFSWFLVIAALIYYYMLDIRLAALATVVLAVVTFFCTLLAGATPGKFSGGLVLLLFIVGVLSQVVGHSFENQKPSNKEGFSLLMVSPLFWMLEVVSLLGFRKFFDIKTNTPPDN